MKPEVGVQGRLCTRLCLKRLATSGPATPRRLKPEFIVPTACPLALSIIEQALYEQGDRHQIDKHNRQKVHFKIVSTAWPVPKTIEELANEAIQWSLALGDEFTDRATAEKAAHQHQNDQLSKALVPVVGSRMERSVER